MTETTLTGGCLCGKVRYDIAAPPLMTAVCHCTNCQKQSGSAYSVLIGVPGAAVSTTGTLKTYEDSGDSGGKVMRQFCPECGRSPAQAAANAVEYLPGLVYRPGSFCRRYL